MTSKTTKTDASSEAAEAGEPKSKDAALSAEKKAALDHVQVSAVGDVSESGEVVGGAAPAKKDAG